MREGYSSCPVCLCVCVSIFSILPSRAFRHSTRGISGYSAENAVKLKSRFFLNCLVQKLEVLTYKLTATKSAIFFTCNVSVYLSVTRT